MEGGEKLTISSKELTLSLHTRPVEVQSFFQTFLLTQYINFSAIMLFFMMCLTINILVCYYDSLNIHSHFFAVFAMEMRINLTMIFTSVAKMIVACWLEPTQRSTKPSMMAVIVPL